MNIIERPDGVKIAACFIATMILTSFISQVWRSTEVRVDRVEFDPVATEFIQALQGRSIRLIAHRPRLSTPEEYASG